jgi:ABC-type bacteriocin/lantibiotic exporter with double-glycine peptidase domain
MWYSKSSGNWPQISDAVFISVFAGIITLILIIFFLRGVVFTLIVIAKATDLHNRMFKSVVYACMNFFDTTPIGRVLNAFSRHQYAIDVTVSDSLFQMLLFLPVTAGAIVLIVVNMYETIGVFGGAAIIAALILLFLGRVEGRLKNREAVTRSTIFSHLTATLEGLFSIRAYQCQERFVVTYREKIDENHKYQFSMMEGKQS